ncbi:MAG: hypothetical protein ACRYFR_00770 [Janthinobacterium lividum]
MKYLVLLLLWLPGPAAWACAWCRPRVQAGIHNAAYTANLVLVLLPVAVLLALGVGLFYWEQLRLRFASAHAIR